MCIRDRHIQQIHNFRLIVDQRQHDHTKSILQLCMLVQLIQNNIGIGILTKLDVYKRQLFVQCGIMRMQTNINDLVPVKEETITAPALQRTNTGKLKMSKSFSVSSEINLLGCTVDEAIAKLDKYLDDAYLAHLPSVRVVHGKGTGALRSACLLYTSRCV